MNAWRSCLNASLGDLRCRDPPFAASAISCAFCCIAAEFDPIRVSVHTWYADIILRCLCECVSRRMDAHLPILSRVWDLTLEVIDVHAMIAVPPGLYSVVVGYFDVERMRRLW